MLHAYEVFLENNKAPTVSKKPSPVTNNNKNIKYNFLAHAETLPLSVHNK